MPDLLLSHRTTVHGEVEGRRWKVEGGRWKVEGGRWKVEGGRWKVAEEVQISV